MFVSFGNSLHLHRFLFGCLFPMRQRILSGQLFAPLWVAFYLRQLAAPDKPQKVYQVPGRCVILNGPELDKVCKTSLRALFAMSLPHRIVSKERRAWVRLASHTVVFDRDPEYARYSRDPGGDIIRILYLWLADAERGATIRHYLGSGRRYGRGGWVSYRELARLFRRTSIAARLVGESGPVLRHRLSRHLRRHFTPRPPQS